MDDGVAAAGGVKSVAIVVVVRFWNVTLVEMLVI